MKILMLGDVIGRPGRRAVNEHLPRLIGEHGPDIVIANGENLAGGTGVTKETALPLFAAGVDVITLGNHAFSQREAEQFIEDDPRIIRPANYPPGVPGRGWGIFQCRNGCEVGVVNLLGRTFMLALDDPFRAGDAAVADISRRTPVIIVDFHAEATSEKGAFAWDFDGRVSAVLGTHTHVPTCDERILPHGSAFITDVGMVGPKDSILGVKLEPVIEHFRRQLKLRTEVASGLVVLNGVVVDVNDDDGRARSIGRISIQES